MNTTAGTGAVRLSPSTVTQYLASQSKRLHAGKRKVVLLRAAPIWEGASELTWGERYARVVPALSPLAVYELALNHLSLGADGPEVLVVLTDQEESELGPDLLARVHRERVNAVAIWDVVRSAFGASDIAPHLSAENWAAEALLDAAPPGGWPRLAGGTLTRRHALASLALRRLGAGQYDPDQEDRPPAWGTGGVELDVNTLLRWSLSAGGPDRFLTLRAAEQAGLARFLIEEDQAGPAGQALLALVTAGHGADAVAFGLVCAGLWVHATESADADDYRARGRAERWFGDEPPEHGEAFDALAEALGRASEEFVAMLLLTARSGGDGSELAYRLSAAVLDRATSLTRQLGAQQAASTSPILPAGIEAACAAAGRALASGDTQRIAKAVRRLEQHQLAARHGIRIEGVKMAQRLTQWLATEPTTVPETVAAGIDRHLAETSWVDLALEHVEVDDDSESELKAVYDGLCREVRARRREIDKRFAQTLTMWTSAGDSAGTTLTVESFLTRVVGPVVRTGERRVLLIVLDGMSAAIAAELGEELRRGWAEYDPLPSAKDIPRRRGMAAAIPTVSSVSRASLFAGKLMIGTQREEKARFSGHSFWGNQDIAVFHEDNFRAEHGGDVFSSELYEAITDDGMHVAVVLSAIDDRLAKEQKPGGGSQGLGDIRGMRELLQLAAEQGRTVFLTSDHGHVADRHGGVRVEAAGEPLSARHRAPGGPLGDAEITLTGPRVVSPETEGEIVALWDADSRYMTLKAGNHGGASLAEFALPVLALLPYGAAAPKGWRELGSQQPPWWSSDVEAMQPSAASILTAPQKRVTKKRQDDAAIAAGKQALFEVDLVPDGGEALLNVQPVSPANTLVNDLLKSPLFQDQLQSLGRKLDLARAENALRALLDAGGTLPVTALAQRIGMPISRADGFAAVLRQLLNFDGIQALETLPDGRTLRLNTSLVREQFELKRAV